MEIVTLDLERSFKGHAVITKGVKGYRCASCGEEFYQGEDVERVDALLATLEDEKGPEEAKGFMSDRVDKAIKEFCELVRQELGANLLGLRLFGSVARGTATPESDIDVLVLVQREDSAAREAVIKVAVDINLKHDVVMSPVIMSFERYSMPLFRETHFYKSLQEEGISL